MDKKINFSSRYKLYNACDKVNYRACMECVNFRDGYAYASDSTILVRVPLFSLLPDLEEQRDFLNGFSIHWKVFKTICGYEKIRIERNDGAGTCHIVATDHGHEISFRLLSSVEVTPPDYEKVFERAKARPEDPIHKIGIKPGHLARLAAAINLEKATLNFRGMNGEVCIENALDGCAAIIMPLYISE